ncbi:MAG: type II secretion system F family protein [Fuerstiella sp.]
MFRNPQISPKALETFCRSMHRMLGSGVPIRKSLKTSSSKSRDARLSSTVADVITDVSAGRDLTSAFRQHEIHYPDLYLDLLNVGEQTGALPEVFNGLAEYYEARNRRMKELRAEITWPVVQLFAAILIIGLVIFITGVFSSSAGGEPADILGIGLVGTKGAITWFSVCFGTMGMGLVAYLMVTRTTTGKAALDPFLMAIPGVGGCMRSFAIARFSWCFALSQQAGMSIKPSLESSMKATANGQFIMGTDRIWEDLHAGETFADALAGSQLFPEQYLNIVETAEASGTVPETLDRLSEQFDEDAHRSMQWLTNVFAKSVWVLVGLFIAFVVINFVLNYVAILDGAINMAK